MAHRHDRCLSVPSLKQPRFERHADVGVECHVASTYNCFSECLDYNAHLLLDGLGISMTDYLLAFVFVAYVFWRLSLKRIKYSYTGTFRVPDRELFEIIVRPGPQYWSTFQIKSLETLEDGSLRLEYKAPELGVQFFTFQVHEAPTRAVMLGTPEDPSTSVIGKSHYDIAIEPVDETTSRLRVQYAIEYAGSFRWSFGKLLPSLIYEVALESQLQKAGLERVLTPDDVSARRWRLAKLFALSLALLSLPFGFWIALSLTLIVLVHEWGHLLAMRALGDRTAQMTLIPLFGGLAISGDRTLSDFKRAIVVLAGPVIGCCLAVATVSAWWLTGDPFYLAVTESVGFINLFNLLPLHPLDGGVIVGLLARPFGSFAVKIAIGLGGAILFAINVWLFRETGAPLVLVLGVLLLWATVVSIRHKAAPITTRMLSWPERGAVLAGFMLAIALTFGVNAYAHRVVHQTYGEEFIPAEFYQDGPEFLFPVMKLFSGPPASVDN